MTTSEDRPVGAAHVARPRARGSARAARVRAAASSRSPRSRRGRSGAGGAGRARRGARARRRASSSCSSPAGARPPGRRRRRRARSAGRPARSTIPARARPRRAGGPAGTWSSSIGNASTSVGPSSPRNRPLRSAIDGFVDEQQRHLGVGRHPLVVEHEPREPRPALEVDRHHRLLVRAEHRHARTPAHLARCARTR